MSEHWITLIPENPQFVPGEDKQRLAESRIREIVPGARDIISRVTYTIQFHNSGVGTDTASCPHCGTVLGTEWWEDAMTEDYDENGFDLKPHRMPCCGKDSTLQDLKYSFPQGFSMYSLEVVNPGVDELAPEHVGRIESALGCRLRVIHQHL